jgi:hypothetical protein
MMDLTSLIFFAGALFVAAVSPGPILRRRGDCGEVTLEDDSYFFAFSVL